MMLLATTTETVGTIASVAAAGLAALALYFARQTVRESEEARRENTAAHANEMKQSGELLAAMVAARDATFDEGFDAFARGQAVERIVGIGSMANLLRSCADLARRELNTTVAEREWTPMTTLAMRLEVAVSLYRAHGGEAESGQPITTAIVEFAARSRGKIEARERILSGANDLLVSVNKLAKQEADIFDHLREQLLTRAGFPPADGD